MGAVTNMQIRPIQNHQRSANLQRSVRRLQAYSPRQSYTLSNLKTAGVGFVIMAGLSLIGKQTIAAGLIAMEAIGLGRQVNNLRKMTPEQRQDAPKGLLAARIAGWSLLGATFVGGAMAVVSGALSPLVVAAWFGGNALGLGTLVTEKIARGFKRRANIRQITEEVQTPAQAKDLTQMMKEENVPQREQASVLSAVDISLAQARG